MIKLIFYGVILVILLKILLNVLNNLTNNIKYVIKEKAQKQEKLKHKEFQRQQKELKQQEILKLRQQEIKKQEELKLLEIKKQEEFQKRFPEVAKFRKIYKEKYIEVIKKQQEQEELRKKYTSKELQKQEFQKQAEFRRKFPEIANYRDEMQIQKNYWDLDEVKGELYYIDKLDNGYQFEEYIANILKKLKYTNVKVTRGSGDAGVDVLANKENVSYAIQCKWSSIGNNVGYKAIQEIYSGKSIYHKDFRNSCNKQLLYKRCKRTFKKSWYHIMG